MSNFYPTKEVGTRLRIQKPLIQAVLIVAVILGAVYLLFGGRPSTQTEHMVDDTSVQSHRSYEIEMLPLDDLKPNKPATVTFKIKDNLGNIQKNFEIVHEKVMHFIVIRKDIQQFQHLHPSLNKNTGEFSVPVTFATDGAYRMFADFTPSTSNINPDGGRLPVTIYADADVGNLENYKPQPIGSTERSKIFDDYSISLAPNAEPLTSQKNLGFTFEIKKNGQPVTNLEQYLGALGHTVVLHEGDLQFIHAHPIEITGGQTGKVTFMITFPEAGNYKLFSQFQHEDKIITSDFVVNVVQGTNVPRKDPILHGGAQH